MIRQIFVLVAAIFLATSCDNNEQSGLNSELKDLTIAYYNVENLFDTIDAPDKWDEEFTPDSPKEWNTEKYLKKLTNLAVVFDSIGGKELPAIIGLEEVENRAVLEDLIKQEVLAAANYQIIHHESPDFRGIDNALLYNPEIFEVLHQEAIPVNMPKDIAYINDNEVTSRDILYVKGKVFGSSIIHVFVNHWTSMYRGEKETIPHRDYCALVLKNKINEILQEDPEANIIAGGDLNENVFAPAVNKVIQADTLFQDMDNAKMYNLSHYLFTQKGKGTYNFKGEWGVLDHILVSGNLLNNNNSIFTDKDWLQTFDSDLVLNYYNNKYGTGSRPNRTYAGPKYFGGFSDHLAIYLHLKVKTKS